MAELPPGAHTTEQIPGDAAPTATPLGDEYDQLLQRLLNTDYETPPETDNHGLEKPTVELTEEEKQVVRSCLEQRGYDIHVPPPLPAAVADTLVKVGIFTSTEPRSPGSFIDYVFERNTEKQFERLRENVENELSNIQAVQSNEHPGKALMDIFRSITKVHVIGARSKKDAKAPLNGTVFAQDTVYVTQTTEEQTDLLLVLTALLKRKKGQEQIMITRLGERAAGIKGMSEYDNRVLENACFTLMCDYLKKKYNFEMPYEKKTRDELYEEGHRFPPEVEELIEALNQSYRAAVSEQAYAYRMRKKKAGDTIITGVAGNFPAWRDEVRAEIDILRGSGQYNQEQDPNLYRRLEIESGVNLVRDLPDADAIHPATPRALKISEQAKQALQQKIASITSGSKTAAVVEVVRTVKDVLDKSSDVSGTLVDVVLGSSEGVIQAQAEIAEYNKRLQAFEGSRQKIIRLFAPAAPTKKAAA